MRQLINVRNLSKILTKRYRIQTSFFLAEKGLACIVFIKAGSLFHLGGFN